ncbi:DUF4326 domain-containing protein [Streptomyces lunalinharesii]|uniref:DUF4326 domain-containing protein n=1 Tax=Streptomyces lunalinharesii TaxID=333384 RepID=A0ABP6E2X4_9ACTN
MNDTTVVNMKGHVHDTAWREGVRYVGRRMARGGWDLPSSRWHNPFPVLPGPPEAREIALRAFHDYLLHTPQLLADLPHLRGQALGCWCAPRLCHAHVLAALADHPRWTTLAWSRLRPRLPG